MDKPSLVRVIVEAVARRHPDYWAVYLYGSADTLSERADSDVDVAVLLPPPRRDLEVLRQDLERALSRNVDLVDLMRAPTILKKEIVLNGRRIACEQELAVGLYEAYVLSSYQRLCRERAAIVSEGLRSGRFYA